MVKLFPRLPLPVAKKLAAERAGISILEARNVSGVAHRTATYAAVGGQRITDSELEQLAERIREVAVEHGYPKKCTQHQTATFEARCAAVLHDEAEITATEAAREGAWAFLACILLPDIVRWRWGGVRSPEDRFVGGERGLRNTLGRLWWRGYMLEDRWWAEHDRHELLHLLSEDQIVGFVERPRAFLSPLAAVAVSRMVLAVRSTTGTRGQEVELMRDVTKRFLRLGTFVSYESLEAEEMKALAGKMVNESLVRLGRAEHVREAEAPRYRRPRATIVARARTAPEPIVETRSGRPGARRHSDIVAQLVRELQSVALSSRSSNRFHAVRTTLASALQMRPEVVGIKFVGDAKNAANRVGEALRTSPAVLLLLAPEELVEPALAAARSRWASSPSTRFLVLARHGEDEWDCSAILEPADGIEFDSLVKLFPDAPRHVELPADGPSRSDEKTEEFAVRTRDGLSLATVTAGDDPERTLEGVFASFDPSLPDLRTKRIVSAKNLGNRISEGLGAGCEVLLLIVRLDLLHAAQEEVHRQLRARRDKPLVVHRVEGDAGSGAVWLVQTVDTVLHARSGSVRHPSNVQHASLPIT